MSDEEEARGSEVKTEAGSVDPKAEGQSKKVSSTSQEEARGSEVKTEAGSVEEPRDSEVKTEAESKDSKAEGKAEEKATAIDTSKKVEETAEEESGTAIDTSKRETTPPSQNVPESNDSSGGGKKRDGFYILVIILLLLAGGYLGYLLSEKNKYINTCQNENAALELEMSELNEMMYDQGLDLGADVKVNLENMLTMYDKMEESNTGLNDSIAKQKQRISEIMVELEDAKGDRSRYMSKVYKLQKETETLRSIMKDYIRTIDSLNVANGQLTENLSETMDNLDKMTEDRNNLASENTELSETVNKGSKLIASGIVSEGIKEKGSGSYKEVTKAKQCTHVRACFNLGENTIAKAGNKTIYMRVITPDGNVLYTSNSNTLTTEKGQSLLYSDKKTINYQNSEINVCIFHKLTQELVKGNYISQIYCEGVMIGQDTFVLK